ncbi:pyridoxal phosphate-dependent decarboxylase family protein [Acidipila rosea]|uniref:Glutamate/tyrosine decarboxylase-like PLP-dependent enzyme n=1 Tax=Acidipila rosea TaxID=768535 RepID=A0A4R1L254_9BACT|nr:pyridoxal-dependent decarboxylase [Acidipila rosea]TCK72072.1 glutamate/tyrosine decarboxylase-like PLP-dependent enzyme [Acidipila rosea]
MTPIAEAVRAQHTLDPENWDELRTLGHRMLDDMFEHLETLRGQPAWQPVPAEVRQALDEPLPRGSQPVESVYQEFVTNIVPYTSGNRHPRAWGWVRGNGTPLAMLAEMLAAGINSHCGGGNQSPTLVEEQVLEWLREIMGMPQGTSGLLTSGGTMANLIGLAVARHAKAGFDIRKDGLQGVSARLTVYCSAETHMWAQKSMELLGLGSRSLRRIAVDAESRIDIAGLRKQIAQDKVAGLHPIAVIGNAGTVNTGSVDDLIALRQLCDEAALWLHVDGAFGALLKLSPKYRHLVRGAELADSLAFDLHKWMYLPFEVGCVLVRDAEMHRAAFATPASYLEGAERGMLAGGMTFSDRGIELTRGFKALKVWMSLKAHGVDAYTALIEQNMEQAAHLADRVDKHAELESLSRRQMNIVCFRYRPGAPMSDEELNRLNREIVLRLQESGEFVVSGTVLDGKYAIRVANTNHRSRLEDFDALAEAVIARGQRLLL